MNKKEMNNKGFSLVELIIVIAIMAILIGVLAPQFIKYVEQSRESTDLQNIEEFKTAIEAAVADGSVTGNVTISINTTAHTISADADLSDYGLGTAGTTKPLKSSKWTGVTNPVYNTSTYSWNAYAGAADYYNIDGTKKGSGSGSSS